MQMRRAMKLGVIGAVGVAMALMLAGSAGAQEMVSYTVTVENLTDGQPFTPPVLVAHTMDMDLFEVGQAASSELSQIAENGNNDPLVAMVSGSAAVIAHVVGDGPVLPGDAKCSYQRRSSGPCHSICTWLYGNSGS